jgi:hypothetical protein
MLHTTEHKSLKSGWLFWWRGYRHATSAIHTYDSDIGTSSFFLNINVYIQLFLREASSVSVSWTYMVSKSNPIIRNLICPLYHIIELRLYLRLNEWDLGWCMTLCYRSLHSYQIRAQTFLLVSKVAFKTCLIRCVCIRVIYLHM